MHFFELYLRIGIYYPFLGSTGNPDSRPCPNLVLRGIDALAQHKLIRPKSVIIMNYISYSSVRKCCLTNAISVTNPEPLPKNHPLLKLSNCGWVFFYKSFSYYWNIGKNIHLKQRITAYVFANKQTKPFSDHTSHRLLHVSWSDPKRLHGRPKHFGHPARRRTSTVSVDERRRTTAEWWEWWGSASNVFNVNNIQQGRRDIFFQNTLKR